MAMVQPKDSVGNTQMDDPDEQKDDTPAKPPEENESENRPSSRGSVKSNVSPGPLPQYQYSKDELLRMSKNEHSKKRPECLDPLFLNPFGVWDPEKWFMSKRQGSDSRGKRDRVPDFDRDLLLGHKRKTPDPKERIKDERDDIVLGPQRRSFGTGCHVSQQSSLARQSGSPVDAKDDVPHRELTRRIGSGRIISRDRDQRDWEREHHEYGYGSRSDRRDRFDREDKDTRFTSRHTRIGDHGERRAPRIRSHRIDEEDEPEWFRGGPTSQSDTIELVGFDDIPEESRKSDKIIRKAKERKSSVSTADEDRSGRASNKSSQRASPVVNGSASQEAPFEETNPTKESQEQLQQEQGPPPPPCSEFDINDMFKSEWFPTFFLNDTPQEEPTEVGESRFSQFFKRNSPVHALLGGSAGNSRRSSVNEELLGNGSNFLSCVSPTLPQSGIQSYEHEMQPTSQASQHSDGGEEGRNILAMLQSPNVGIEQFLANQATLKDQNLQGKARNVEELEASLKQLVLGNKETDMEDKSVFNKLVSQLADGRSTSPSLSLSMGPLDKSKALQEEDLIQNMFRDASSPSPPFPTSPPTHSSPNHLQHPVASSPHLIDLHGPTSPGNDANSALMPGHVSGQTIINMLKENENADTPDIPVTSRPYSHDVLLHESQPAKQDLSGDLPSMFSISTPPLLPHQSTMCGTSPNSVSNRNGNQAIAALLQQQKQQQDLLSMLVQQQQQQMPNLAHQRSPVIQDPMAPPMPQTLGVPLPSGRVLSPRQSPLPQDAISPILSRQNRSPSPLVFGQQPPVLSHAPAPIHPSQLTQTLGPVVPSAGNTLQVQNSSLLPRVPSPQELVAHTQSILQNALIKHKLVEQREKYRKQQEAQRARSPTSTQSTTTTVPSKPTSASPSKGISSTMAAFTPTSVMRKMHSEKLDKDPPKFESTSNQMLRSSTGARDSTENATNVHTNGCMSTPFSSGSSSLDQSLNTTIPQCSESSLPRSVSVGVNGGPSSSSALQRGQLHLQGNANRGVSRLPTQVGGAPSSTTSQHVSGQGRAIVKGSNLQSATTERISSASQKMMQYGKNFPGGSNQGQLFRSDLDSMAKLLEQQRLLQQQHQQAAALAAQRQLNTSPMPPNVLHPAFGIGPRAPNITHPSGIVRPGGINLSSPVGTANINHPLLRNMMHSNMNNPAALRAQASSLSQLSQLNQLAVLQQQQQQQQRQLDPRQLQALSQARGLPPLALHQLLLNAAQNQAAVAAAAAAAVSATQVPSAGLLTTAAGGGAANASLGMSANARGSEVCSSLVMPKTSKLAPCQNATNRQSPVNNLSKWFGNDVLKQKMPDLPPVPRQKALLLEDVERQQQQAAAVHN